MKTKIIWVLFLFIWQLFLSQITTRATESELSREDLQAIAKSMRAVEDALQNVRIESESWVEHGSSSSGPWQRTPVSSSKTAFFGPISCNRARINVHKSVMPWKNGKAPYHEQSYSVSFDGTEGRRKSISSHYNDKTFEVNRGSVLPKAPPRIGALRFATGIKATLFFHYRDLPEPLPRRFSTGFEAMVDVNSFTETLADHDPNYADITPLDYKVVFDKLEGVRSLKVVVWDERVTNKLWFDPDRGFALLRVDELREGQDGNGDIISSIKVTELEKVSENIWWPMEAYFIRRTPEKEQPWRRIVYRASDVEVNDPHLDDSIFTISFPEGTRVHDELADKTYVVGDEDK